MNFIDIIDGIERVQRACYMLVPKCAQTKFWFSVTYWQQCVVIEEKCYSLRSIIFFANIDVSRHISAVADLVGSAIGAMAPPPKV
jgi:hypothetical protein